MDPSLISDMMNNPKMMKTMEGNDEKPRNYEFSNEYVKKSKYTESVSGLNVPEMEKAYKADLSNNSSTENESTTQESTENTEQQESNETNQDESNDIIEVKDEITGDTIIKPNPENISQEPKNMDDEMFSKLLNDEKFSVNLKILMNEYLKNKKRNTLCLRRR